MKNFNNPYPLPNFSNPNNANNNPNFFGIPPFMPPFPEVSMQKIPEFKLPFPEIPLEKPQKNVKKLSMLEFLNLNKEKILTCYMNFQTSQWGSKIFKGRLSAVGEDFIILSDINSTLKYFLPKSFLDYITFDEDLNLE